MSKKNTKIDKETRKLMESVGDLVKKRNGRYGVKGKHKKKLIKKMHSTCVHWIYRKGKPIPTVIHDPNNPNHWKCTICGASFPIQPLRPSDPNDKNWVRPYADKVDEMLVLINQMQFWGIAMGGDSDDTKMFLQLRKMLPRFKKVSKSILKMVMKRDAMENNPDKNNIMAAFDSYNSYSYRQ